MQPFKRLASVLAAASIVTACMDHPDRLRHLLPKEVQVGSTLSFRTKWGSCATAVFALDLGFQIKLLKSEGVLYSLNKLNASAYDHDDHLRWQPWQKTPIITDIYDMGIVAANLAQSSECLQYSSEFNIKAEKYSYTSAGAFYSTSNYSDIALLIPEDGILIIFGH